MTQAITNDLKLHFKINHKVDFRNLNNLICGYYYYYYYYYYWFNNFFFPEMWELLLLYLGTRCQCRFLS